MNLLARNNKPFFYLGLFAIPLLIGMIAMSSSFSGFNKLIIPFEFAKSHNDLVVIEMAAINGYGAEGLTALDAGNKIDFAFMLFYSAFIFLFFLAAKKAYNLRYLILPQLLAIPILAGDFIENLLLLGITKTYDLHKSNEFVETYLDLLQYATWSKWGLIAVCTAFASILLGKHKGIGYRIASIILLLPIVAFLPAIFGLSYDIKNIFAGSVFLALAVLVISCFFINKEKLKV